MIIAEVKTTSLQQEMSLSHSGPSIGQRRKEQRKAESSLCPIDGRTWALESVSTGALSSQAQENCRIAGAALLLRLEP